MSAPGTMAGATRANGGTVEGVRLTADSNKPHRALRVAAVVDTAPRSGPGRQLVAIAHALQPLGVDLHVVTFERDRAPSGGFRAVLESEAVPHTVIRDGGPFDPAVPVKLARVLRDLRPDVVQTHGYKASTYAWLLRKAGSSWPWAAFFHGETHENAKIRFYNWLHLRVLAGADQVITMSSRQAVQIRNPHVRVIHNAVLDVGQVSDSAFSGQLERASVPHPRLLVIGRLSPEKGVDVMLHALRTLNDRGCRVGLLIVGDGPERDRLGALAIALDLSASVAFLPTTTDISAAYRAGDVLVIPSRSEGLPNVLLEALAHDLPVVATDVGAVREVLGDSGAGIIVPAERPEAIADALAPALAMRGDIAAHRARQEVVARFSLPVRAREHADLYRELVSRQRTVDVKRATR